MSKAAVKISTDLLSNPLCEQDQDFLESMNALDTAMKRMDSFNQEKVGLVTIVLKWIISCLCLLCTQCIEQSPFDFSPRVFEMNLYHPSL